MQDWKNLLIQFTPVRQPTCDKRPARLLVHVCAERLARPAVHDVGFLEPAAVGLRAEEEEHRCRGEWCGGEEGEDGEEHVVVVFLVFLLQVLEYVVIFAGFI